LAQVDNAIIIGQKEKGGKTFWCASMFSNDADTTGNLIVKAAPSSGALFVDHIMVICDQDAQTISINDDTTPIFGPYEMTATEYGGFIDIRLNRAIQLGGALRVDAGANGVINVIAEGYTIG
jgi:hypothetical protein